jgi:glycosyltransferase involved in cell wall biosynthesis
MADELDTAPLPIPVVGRRVSRVPSAAVAVHRAVAETRPDVIHAHNPTMALLTGLATRRGKRPPGLVSLHGGPEEDWPAAVRLVRLSGLAPVACGPGVAAALEERKLMPLATVPNAVPPAPPSVGRAELGLPPDVQLVLAVGRLVEQKNHALAVRAIAQVPDAVLAIAGTGPLLGDLERQARETGVADRVLFLGLRPDARALMGAADVVVMPSRWEGLPLSALEALASGTPLVATDVRGLRELVTDDQNALLVPEEPRALAVALRRVLDDPELASRLGAAGTQVEGAGSDERLVARFLELYARLAA